AVESHSCCAESSEKAGVSLQPGPCCSNCIHEPYESAGVGRRSYILPGSSSGRSPLKTDGAVIQTAMMTAEEIIQQPGDGAQPELIKVNPSDLYLFTCTFRI